MPIPKETSQLIKQLADDLEQWIDKEPDKRFPDFQFLSQTIFYASNVDKKVAAQQLSRIERILLSLRKHNQGWADTLGGKVEDLKAALSSVDRLVGYGYSRHQCVHTLETPALRLAQTLRDIAKMAEEDLSPEKPAQPEQNVTPAKHWKITTWLGKIFEKALYIFTKSFWEALLERLWPK